MPTPWRGSRPRGRRKSLWRHRDFLVYWLGQTISRGGVQIAEFVLPLAAITMFSAPPPQLGWLNAIAFAPYRLVTSD